MKKDYERAIKNASKILDAWLPLKIQYDRLPGLAVGIVHHGKLVYQKGFGYADIELKTPVTPRTCFRIASISKTFTAVAIMQLVENGKINLDDAAEKHLPWFSVDTKSNHLSTVTIRQLLSHTAGVFRDGDTPHWETDEFPDLEGLKKSISHKTAISGILTEFKYSNFGFALLGEIIKEASGEHYDEYVSNHIIKKLGMHRTAPDFSEKLGSWLARGYSRPIPNEERNAFNHSKTKSYSSATGFLSNVPDLAKYLSNLSLDKECLNSLLKVVSKRTMTERHWDTEEEDGSYGLGFHVGECNGRKIIYHGGGFAGFTSEITLDTKNALGIITLSNTNDVSCGFINRGILETIYELTDKRRRYENGRMIPNRSSFEGVYRSRWRDTVIVGVDNKLVAITPQDDSPLENAALLNLVGENNFSLESKAVFDSPGEPVIFNFKHGEKRASQILVGAAPSQRLE